MSLRIAGRVARMHTEGAFVTLARAKQLEAAGRDVVHLEIGEPDFSTPDHITEAAIDAIQRGYTHYTQARGLPEARGPLAEFIGRRVGFEVDPERVLIVPGSKNAISFVLTALLEPGDEVILPDPGYPAYSSLVGFLEGVPVPVTLREELDFRLDLDELRARVSPRTRAIIINSPHNPTGGVLAPADLEAIAELAIRHDLCVISDEIYAQIIFEGEHRSIMALPGMADRTVLVDGMSKAYAMCGWRLGFAVLPPELVAPAELQLINTSSCAAAFGQVAAAEAVSAPESVDSVRRMVEEFKRRRDLVVELLNQIPGVSCRMPAGAFYAFPNIKRTGLSEAELASALLEEAGVAVLPGTAFGRAGAGYLRLAYTQGEERLREGLRRINQYLTAKVR